MKKTTGFYPAVSPKVRPSSAVGQAGGALLVETVGALGLEGTLSRALAPWRKPLSSHDPAKIVLDLALTLALGGDCLADINMVRCEPGVYGRVASDPTVSRVIQTLAGDADKAVRAINKARACVRERAWDLAGSQAPDHGCTAKKPLIIDLDATLLTSHSDKEQAAPTFKRGYGFHPLCAFVDHGEGGTGEPLAVLLRPGNAGSNTARDHIQVIRSALAQLPGHSPKWRGNKSVLVRTDGAGATHDLTKWLTTRRLSYSLGFTLPHDTPHLLHQLPQEAWSPALDADGQVRQGAWVAELTGVMDLTSWPTGMRVIVRKERPHPGAQLRFEDVDGMRITAFATNTTPGGPHQQIPDLELRHRRRARCEDRIRLAKETGLRNLPLYSFNQNRIWVHIVQLALDLTAWMQTLALTHHEARKWEAKRLRYRLYQVPAVLTRHARARILNLADHHPYASLLANAITTLRSLTPALDTS